MSDTPPLGKAYRALNLLLRVVAGNDYNNNNKKASPH